MAPAQAQLESLLGHKTASEQNLPGNQRNIIGSGRFTRLSVGPGLIPKLPRWENAQDEIKRDTQLRSELVRQQSGEHSLRCRRPHRVCAQSWRPVTRITGNTSILCNKTRRTCNSSETLAERRCLPIRPEGHRLIATPAGGQLPDFRRQVRANWRR